MCAEGCGTDAKWCAAFQRQSAPPAPSDAVYDSAALQEPRYFKVLLQLSPIYNLHQTSCASPAVE